jgi:hypothetical protein
MKLCKQVKNLVESTSKALSDAELRAFWKDIKEIVLNQSDADSDMSLFSDGTNVTFHTLQMDDNGDLLDLEDNVSVKSSFKSESPKELCQIILNSYTLESESSEEQDDMAFEHFLKNLKGETVNFFGVAKNSPVESNGKKSMPDIEYEGKLKVKNFRYNPSKEVLEVTDYDILEIEVVE